MGRRCFAANGIPDPRNQRPHKDERPREFLRRNAYRGPCSASGVPLFRTYRHQDLNAEDIARLFCKQTQIEVLWALHLKRAHCFRCSEASCGTTDCAWIGFTFALTPQIVLGSHKLVHVNDSEFFILFKSYLKDFLKACPRKYGPATSRFTSKEAFSKGARIYGDTNDSFSRWS